MLRAALFVGVVLLSWGTNSSAQPTDADERVAELMRRPLDQRAARWRCEPDHVMHCSGTGCQQTTPKVWMLLAFSRGCTSDATIAGATVMRSLWRSQGYTRWSHCRVAHS
jgi:hypothetical protein